MEKFRLKCLSLECFRLRVFNNYTHLATFFFSKAFLETCINKKTLRFLTNKNNLIAEQSVE